MITSVTIWLLLVFDLYSRTTVGLLLRRKEGLLRFITIIGTKPIS